MRLIDADSLRERYYQRMEDLLKAADKIDLSENAISLLCGTALIFEAPTIEAEDVRRGMCINCIVHDEPAEPTWMPASVTPQKSDLYLTLWALNKKGIVHYKLLNYGDFEDWNDELKLKTGWWKYDSEYGVCNHTENVLYWMPIPAPPKEDLE